MAELHPGALDEALLALGPAPPFSRFCEVAEPLFKRLFDERTYIPWIAQSLAELVQAPNAIAGAESRPYQLWTARHGRLILFPAESKRDGHPPTLVGHGAHRLRRVVSGELWATYYHHPHPHDPNTLDRTARLELVKEEKLGPGALVRIEAWRDVVEFTAGSGVVLGLDSAPLYSVRWAYHRDSLLPIAAVVADQTLARIGFAIQMLAEIGTAEDAPGLEPLMKNHSHSVRWSAIRAAVKLGHPESRALVERALADPHPHVQNAAKAALPLFDAGGGAP